MCCCWTSPPITWTWKASCGWRRAIEAANACLVVTHDRYFLENVATQMVEVNPIYPESAFQVKGNYSEFLERREEFLEAQAKQQESLATKVRREVEWLRRGPKARTGKSRARVDSAGRLIEELSAATVRSRTATAQIDFTASDRKTKRLIEAEGIGKTLGGRRLFQNLNLTLSPGVRVGLVGANGSGKTTLLKILEGAMGPDEGTIQRADRLQIVSFAQDRGAHLDLEISLRRTLCPEGDSVIYRGRPIHVAGWAKRFLFQRRAARMPVSRLSGGERARVMIARLMLAAADVLLLDEPTNDLDIPTLEVLEDSLLEFSGAVVLVSHDRYLLDRVSTIVIGLDGRRGTDFRRLLAVGSVAKRATRRATGGAGAHACRLWRKAPRRSWPTWNSASGTAWKRRFWKRNRSWAFAGGAASGSVGCEAGNGGLRKTAGRPTARGGFVRALGGAGGKGGAVKRGPAPALIGGPISENRRNALQ